MKKLILLIGTLLLLFIGGFISTWIYPKNTPTFKNIKSTVLIDRLTEQDLSLRLLYSDLTASQIETYGMQSSSIELLETPYSSFTEGFIETEKNTLLLETVNQYRSVKGQKPITYYYNYTEIDQYGFLSLTEGLDTLYIIDLATYEVTSPSFDTTYASENQYIYHISSGDDVYYLLSAQANGYKAYLYTLSKENFHVLSARRLSPPSKANRRTHYALDSSGNAYFIGNFSLLIMTPEETINLPLNFNPDSIYCKDDEIYTFSSSELFLSYAIYKDDLGIIQTGQVNLPNKFVKLISYHIADSILYTVTYDDTHPMYRNYITLYNLKNNNILYCLALKEIDSDHLTLLDAHFG